MPKVRLTKEQAENIAGWVRACNSLITTKATVDIEISADQIINEPTNVEKWEVWLKKRYVWAREGFPESIAYHLDKFGCDATPAYNEVMKSE